jgi:hypothetical protein
MGFELATDAAFRMVAGFSEPPKAGQVVGLELSGQYRIHTDDDGGEVLAWPINGFEYGLGDVVYVLLSGALPASGIILGSHAPAPTLPGTVVDASLIDHGDLGSLAMDDHPQYVLADGSRSLDTLRIGNSGGLRVLAQNIPSVPVGDSVRIDFTSLTSLQVYTCHIDLALYRSNNVGNGRFNWAGGVQWSTDSGNNGIIRQQWLLGTEANNVTLSGPTAQGSGFRVQVLNSSSGALDHGVMVVRVIGVEPNNVGMSVSIV